MAGAGICLFRPAGIWVYAYKRYRMLGIGGVEVHDVISPTRWDEVEHFLCQVTVGVDKPDALPS